jgi:hypothetical protein
MPWRAGHDAGVALLTLFNLGDLFLCVHGLDVVVGLWCVGGMRPAEEPLMNVVAKLIGYLVIVLGGWVLMIKGLEWLLGV